MVVLLVIDMQVGLFGDATPRFDPDAVIDRINRVADAVRDSGGSVIFIQHDSKRGGPLEPNTEGWKLLPALKRVEGDRIVRKQACDAFYETDLEKILDDLEPEPLIITGCATEFCVDTTVRAATSRDYQVVIVEDGHTTTDRPHLKAEEIIEHHNWVWTRLILPRSRIKAASAKEVIRQITMKQ